MAISWNSLYGSAALFFQYTSLEPKAISISDFPLDTLFTAHLSYLMHPVPNLWSLFLVSSKLPYRFYPSHTGCIFLLVWLQWTSFPILKNKQTNQPTNQPTLQLLPFIYRKKKKSLNSDLTLLVFYFITTTWLAFFFNSSLSYNWLPITCKEGGDYIDI